MHRRRTMSPRGGEGPDAETAPNRRHRPLSLGVIAATIGVLVLLALAAPGVLAKQPAGPPVSLAIIGLADGPAGTVQSVRVTALLSGKPNLGYRGTVIFSSSDTQAGLPTSYRFTPADKGTRVFPVTLRTAGAQTLTIRDVANAALTASHSVTIAPIGMARLSLTGLVDAVAGTAQSVTVTAFDPYGNVATGHRGAVEFSSIDSQADLPANHGFTAGDAGSHTFVLVLKTAGAEQSVTASDLADPARFGEDIAAITSGPVDDLVLSAAIPGPLFEGKQVATAGQPFSVTIRAVDAYGNTSPDYRGTVDLESSDQRTTLPGGPGIGRVTFGAADAGSVTLNDVTFFRKRIYDDNTTLAALDHVDRRLASGLTFQVLPGPAVSYDSCHTPLSASSSYTEPNSPVGVNDGLGIAVTALDAYGNDATNREPSNVLRDRLPLGYHVDVPIITSDPRAVFPNIGSIARISASRLSVGPEIEAVLRTAGEQTLTLTDPHDPTLTITCTYDVRGPRAFTGTLDVADPYMTGNVVTWLQAAVYIPPNDPGVTISGLGAPLIDQGGGLVPLGQVTADDKGKLKFVQWDLMSATGPAGMATCDTTAPCVVTGPRTITFVLADGFGNRSNGQITVNLWTKPAPPVGTVYFDRIDGKVTLDVGGTHVPADTSIKATVGATTASTTIVQLDGIGNVTILTPTGSTLTTGDKVSAVLREPLVVGGNVPTCVPEPNKPCEVASFVAVTIIDADPDDPLPDQAPLTGYQTMGTDTCGFFLDPFSNICPAITLGLPGPDIGYEGEPYDFTFLAGSTDPRDQITAELIAFQLPPGLTLEANRRLHGTPAAGSDPLYSVQIRFRGTVSGATTVWALSLIIQDAKP